MPPNPSDPTMRAVAPPEKPTTQLPAVPDWAIKLTMDMKEGFAKIGGDISLVANDVSVTKDRVALIETRVNVLEEARTKNSLRAATASQADLEHEAKLAKAAIELEAERKAREELAVKVDLVYGVSKDIKAALATPLVQRAMKSAAYLLIVAATLAAGYAGGHEKGKDDAKHEVTK